MASVCYRWDDTPFKWMEAPFTWKEGCVIEKIIEGIGTTKVKKKIEELTDDEKQTLIHLFIRLNVDEIVIEKRINKHKNKKVKIKLKDVEVSTRAQKIINVNVKIND